MAILFVFLLGLGNFALHKAVLESGHPMVEALPESLRRNGSFATLAMEFAILVAALLLVANRHPGWGWAYLGYSGLNAATAWLVLTRRI